jgi:hypothetical protein
MGFACRSYRSFKRSPDDHTAHRALENPGGRHLLKLKFQLERFADGEISC